MLNCNNYKGIKPLKLWERVVESRLRKIVSISKRQYGFQKGKSTTQPMLHLRILEEKLREVDKTLHLVFVELEKAYDMVPREFIWYCLRRKLVPEEYVRILQDMHLNCKTRVASVVGQTEDIEVSLHQGLALGRLFFINILGIITEDDLVLRDGEAEDLEGRLERWR